MTNSIRRLGPAVLLALQSTLLCGCATLTRDGTQTLQIETVDEQGLPVHGMRCHATNFSSEFFGDSPMYDLPVERSASDLRISCHLGDRVAEGVAVSRGGLTGTAAMLLPGGSAYVIIDHLSGYRYTYPTWLRLQIGQKLIFDANNEVLGKPVPGVRAKSDHPAPAAQPVADKALVRSD